jgi:hypothetical protein
VNPKLRRRGTTGMRARLMILFAAATPFILAGCGKGKY